MFSSFRESWGEAEEISTEFPFNFNQQFKLSMAFTNIEFKVAVNGAFLMRFPLSNIELEDGQSLWEILTGFQIKTGLDMDVKVSRVQHQILGSNCDGFEQLSAF